MVFVFGKLTVMLLSFSNSDFNNDGDDEERGGEDTGSNVMISLQPVPCSSLLNHRIANAREGRKGGGGWACPWSSPTVMPLAGEGVMNEVTCGQRGSFEARRHLRGCQMARASVGCPAVRSSLPLHRKISQVVTHLLCSQIVHNNCMGWCNNVKGSKFCPNWEVDWNGNKSKLTYMLFLCHFILLHDRCHWALLLSDNILLTLRRECYPLLSLEIMVGRNTRIWMNYSFYEVFKRAVLSLS